MANERILIVDDEPDLREILRMQLEFEGYRVLEASNGAEAVVVAKEQAPDLIVLDIMMPEMDGIEVVNRLRGSFATRNIPVILATAKCHDDDKVVGLASGANDYVTKPYNRNELMIRVHRMLEWSNEQRSVSPLTGLPGNHAINKAIRARLEQEQAFGMLQIDIDHFKAFNDYYGYGRGDEAIQLLAFIARDAVTRMGGPEGFVGHIGGDDFVVLAPVDVAEEVGEEIVDRFRAESEMLYDPEDRERGFVEVLNRQHVADRFPLMSLTVAYVSTDRVPVTHMAQLIDIAHELKARGKGIPGSVIVGERRRRPDNGPANQKVA